MATSTSKDQQKAGLELEKNRIAFETAVRSTQFLLSDPNAASLGTNIGQDDWQANYRKHLTQMVALYKKLL